jgi:transcriptional regulator with XRE-family HTH domain
MPANPPRTTDRAARVLDALGEQIRERRKQLKLTATAAAEAAAMSRVTWHRLERGEPSVTMGAYLNALVALGLDLAVTDPSAAAGPPADAAVELPATIRLDDYPQLRALAWQTGPATELTPFEALSLYERNWRHVDHAALTPDERDLVRRLTAVLGGGRLLV